MADPTHAADLALALQIADEADALTLGRFRALDLSVETKPDLTPVSDADRAVEQAVRSTIGSSRPADLVLGEEYGGDPGAAGRQWVVDPIDGTKNFVRGVPVWATLLALRVDGEVVLGVVSAPSLGRRWWATRGAGAHSGGSLAAARRCRVSGVAALEDAALSYASLSGWEAAGRLGGLLELTRRTYRTRAFGDFWSHVLVAEGAVDVSAEPEVSLWDVAPLQVIVEEAGGRFSDLDGAARPDRGSIVCTNGLLHDEVLGLLRAG
ncbi:MAG: histidinol phosphatase [Actinomycetota bacterium]|nr:histidinol phosphatase [Actinomycetota bacterium]